MPLISSASKVYQGSNPALRVYQGTTQVWTASVPLNLFPDNSTFVDQGADGTAFSMGTEFYVNKSGCYVTQVRYLQPTVGNLTLRSMALYANINGTTGTQLGSWTMPTPVAGQWCTYTLPTPIALTANQRYRITTYHPGGSGFARTFNYFSTGLGQTTTTLGGYLVIPNSADAMNGQQGSYYYSPAGPVYPVTSYNSSAYYSDVTVVDSI